MLRNDLLGNLLPQTIVSQTDKRGGWAFSDGEGVLLLWCEDARMVCHQAWEGEIGTIIEGNAT